MERSSAPSPAYNSQIPFKQFRDATFMVVNSHTGAVQAILQYKGDIVRHPQIREIVDLFFNSSNDSMDFLAELERSLRQVRQQNSQLMISLNSTSDTRKLEGIRKFAGQPDSFSEPLIKRLMKLIDTYTNMQGELERRYQLLVDQSKSEKEQSSIASVSKKIIGTIVTTAQVARHMLEGIVTGNSVGLAGFVSSADHNGEQSDLGSAVRNLWMGAKKREELLDIINTMKRQTYVVEEFENIRRRVDTLIDKIGLLSKSADEALDWKEVAKDEGAYSETVKQMMVDGVQVGKDMVLLEKDIFDCRETVISARKEIIGRAMNRIKL